MSSVKYSPSHEWIAIEGTLGTVGITKYAGKELGEIVYVQLPAVGAKFLMGEEIAVLESTKAAADIYAPISGEVIEINEVLQKDLSSLNQNPESAGWLFKMRIENVVEGCLLSLEEYQEMIASS
jgi:glycine cleavage system H protein